MLERFVRSLDSLLPPTSHPLPLAIAISGGSDSTALLHLARLSLPHSRLVALTVDHGLRPESTSEAQAVQRTMQALGVTHHLLHWQHGGTPSGNLQAEARKARYRLMSEACRREGIEYLLLGHTEDDQAETIAFMQARASGAVGLAGMSARREMNGITLLRPLLGFSRAELRHWLQAQSIRWIDDPSNENEDFTRIRLRRELQADPARKAELLALGRQMEPQRLQIEQRHAEFCRQYATLDENTLHCPVEMLLALGEAQAAYTLGRMIQYIGGQEYPPRYAKRLRCLHQLAAPGKRQLTLGNCLIERNGATLHLRREKDSAPMTAKPLVPPPFTPIFREYE